MYFQIWLNKQQQQQQKADYEKNKIIQGGNQTYSSFTS